jgi:hypothetical protein
MTVQQHGNHRATLELWPQRGGEEVRDPSSEAVSAGDTAVVSAGVADSAAVLGGDSAASPGRAKTSALGRKTVPGPFAKRP